MLRKKPMRQRFAENLCHFCVKETSYVGSMEQREAEKIKEQ